MCKLKLQLLLMFRFLTIKLFQVYFNILCYKPYLDEIFTLNKEVNTTFQGIIAFVILIGKCFLYNQNQFINLSFTLCLLIDQHNNIKILALILKNIKIIYQIFNVIFSIIPYIKLKDNRQVFISNITSSENKSSPTWNI